MQVIAFFLFAMLSAVCLSSELKVCNVIVENAKLRDAQQTLDAKAQSFKINQEAFLRSIDKQQQAADIFYELLIMEHEIVRGDGLLITLRTASRKTNIVDSGDFKRLSIEIPAAVQGQAYTFGANGNRAFYSEGATAWIPNGNGFYSRRPKGEIRIIEVNDKIVTAYVDAEIDAIYLSPFEGDDRRNLSIKGTYTLIRISFDEMEALAGC